MDWFLRECNFVDDKFSIFRALFISQINNFWEFRMDYTLRLANLLTLCTYHISLIQSIIKHEKHLHMLRCFVLSFTANKQKKPLVYCCLLFAIYFDFFNVFYDFSCRLNFGLSRRYFTWIKFHERNILWYFTQTIFCDKGQHLQSSWNIIGTKINALKVIRASR